MFTIPVPVEALRPGQRFAEVGTSVPALGRDDFWYVLEWVNPSERTYAFHNLASGAEPGSMRYSAGEQVLARFDDAMDASKALLQHGVDEETQTAVARLFNAGEVEWAYDPEVPGVCGILLKNTNRAVAVFYPRTNDFEVDDDLLYREQ